MHKVPYTAMTTVYVNILECIYYNTGSHKPHVNTVLKMCFAGLINSVA